MSGEKAIDIIGLLAPIIAKIAERLSKGKRLSSADMSLLLLFDMSGRLSGISSQINHLVEEIRRLDDHLTEEIKRLNNCLTEEIREIRSDIRPLIDAVAEFIRSRLSKN